MSSANPIKSRLAVLAACAAGLLLLLAAPASAAPQWRLTTAANTTAAPGSSFIYGLSARNVGDAEAGGLLTIVGALPAGVTAQATFPGWDCTGDGPGAPPGVVGASNLTCSRLELFPTQEPALLTVTAAVDPAAAEGAADAAFDLYAPPSFPGGEPSTLPDGTPCSEASPGTPCASSVETMRIASTPPSFGIEAFDAAVLDSTGEVESAAGIHPFAQTTWIDVNAHTNPNADPDLVFDNEVWPVAPPKDIIVDLPPGLIGDLTEMDRCDLAELSPGSDVLGSLCPVGSQIGVTSVKVNGSLTGSASAGTDLPLYNMAPPPDHPARFGFNLGGTVVVIDFSLRPDYGLSADVRYVGQGLTVAGSRLTVWGVPSDPVHDAERACPASSLPSGGGPTCEYTGDPVALLRNPTACGPEGEGLTTALHIDSWHAPGDFESDGRPDLSDPAWESTSSDAHESPGFPYRPSGWGAEKAITGCDAVPVKGDLEAKPTARDAETPSGLQVQLEVPNPGIENPEGVASSDLRKVRVSLPQGMTINPSQAEGLGVCSEAAYESSALSFLPDNPGGCPEDSKIGTVEVTTPLLDEKLPGEVYIAEPFGNPFGSLLAIYVVIEEPQRGILIKLPGRVETDGTSGRIVTTFDDLPQQPFDTFLFKFREGARAPLVTPPACGTYTTKTEIWGHSDPDGPPLVSESSFQIDRGIGGGPCPAGGLPGFDPGFSAGTVNNNAGSFSPTVMRLTRRDGEQNLTKFSATLAPGLLAKLAGVERCADAAIAAAKVKSGRAELAAPSCPPNSRIGHTLAGAGVGSVLTYVPGTLYLAGPYNGAPLSIVSITAAVAGPFDVGTVVVREALDLDPKTAVARVDGSASDPIPHILQGIPLKLRDLRVYVDREGFTLNPTSCDPFQIGATLWGSAADIFDPADDGPVNRASRFQAASCASLGFKPRLRINLRGGTKRSRFPALRAELNARPGDANIGKVRVRLPKSEFLAQQHIGTVCTRVEFSAGPGNGEACPSNSVYGWARAWTPLLDEPLEGPVFLRANGGERKLPDLVAALRGLVDIELEGHIDSKDGGIRATFASVPDAPVSRFVLSMKGGRKGLLENSTNICRGRHRATVEMDGQNGAIRDFKPLLKANCAKRKPRRGGR